MKSIVLATLLAFAPTLINACGSDSAASGDGDTAITADTNAATDVAGTSDLRETDPFGEIAEDACSHLQLGPFEPAAAAAVADSAPELEPGHHVDQLTLADFEGGHGGYVKLHVLEAGDYFLGFAAEGLAYALQTEAGEPVVPEHTPDVSERCGVLETAAVFELVEGRYVIEIGPSDTLSAVDLIVLDAGDAHHHEDE